MKKLITALFAGILALGVQAQEQRKAENQSPEEIAKHRVERMTEKLALNEEQAATVEKAMISKISQARALKEKLGEGKREEFKEAMQPIQEEFMATMKSTLSAEQFSKWEEFNKKQYHQHLERKKARAEKIQENNKKTPEELAAEKVKKMTESLGLSEDQATAIEKAMVVKITEIRALKVKFAENKEEFKKAAQPIREQFQTTVKNTLSEEQFKKLQELRKERGQDSKTKKGNKLAKRAIKAHPEK